MLSNVEKKWWMCKLERCIEEVMKVQCSVVYRCGGRQILSNGQKNGCKCTLERRIEEVMEVVMEV